MNSAHDVGGMHGFGAVRREENEPVFHAEWERVVFAMTVLAGAQGLTGPVDASRHAIERMGNLAYLSASYYQRWLAGLSTLLVEKDVISAEELAARVEAVRHDLSAFVPPPADVFDELAVLAAGMLEGGESTLREVGQGPRFAVGTGVVTSLRSPRGHTRLPRYARGRRGRVVRHHGAHVFPDTNAHGLGECPEHLYSVRFEAYELWSDTAEERSGVYLDLWESYLEMGDG